MVFVLFLAIALLIPTLLTNQYLYALCVTSQHQTKDYHLQYTYTFEKPTFTDVSIFNQTFTKIELHECFSYADPGHPTLPVFIAQILLPQGTNVANMYVTSTKSIPLLEDICTKPILPEQEYLTLSNHQQPRFIMDTEIYNSTTPVFKSIYEDGGIGYCRGYAIQTIYLYPVTYIPKTAVLSYFPEITIHLELTYPKEYTSGTVHPLLRNTNADQNAIRKRVANPHLLSTYTTQPLETSGDTTETGEENPNIDPTNGYNPLDNTSYGLCNPEDSYPFVIITSNSLKHTTGYPYNWSSLITHRATYSGLNGTIVTVQEIQACSYYWNSTPIFNDTQARIRAFCKDAYLNWETEYIILGGDWDDSGSNQIVPYRLFTDPEETNPFDTMACDMYYSHLDGTWYYSFQDIWGGGKNSGVNDYYGELYIGRIPAYDASMVSNAVQKIIWYDLIAEGDWLAQSSFLGGDLGWIATSKQYMEEIRLGTDTWRTFIGFEEWNAAYPQIPIDTTERIYHADIGSTYKTYISNSITNDNASILNHLDHSYWSSPFGLTSWTYRYNTKPFFGFSQGCLAGRFHEGYAGPEQLLCRHPERHAYGLVLNTGYGYCSASSTNGPSQYLQSYFWDYFFNDQANAMNNWQLGKANLNGHDKLAAKISISHRVFCYAWYSAHLFGDPAQTLRITDNAGDFILSNENPPTGSTTIPITTSTLNVTIQHSQNYAFSYTIQTTPHIGSCAAQNQSNGQKTCTITNLNYSTTYTWYVNVTDGTITTNQTYIFTTEMAIENQPILIVNPGPTNQSTGVPKNISVLNITLLDPEGKSFNWTITTTPFIGTAQGINESNGTKICNVFNLSESTTYTWYIYTYDGHQWTNRSYWFTTETVDSTPPDITNIQLVTSIPMDLDPAFGWENFTCEVTDNSIIHTVLFILIYPDDSTFNHTMTKKDETNIFYFNTSLKVSGQYSYYLWANDTYNNTADSPQYNFSLPSNWDINNDGKCTVLDLTFVSNLYGQTNICGWTREDVDNNGEIQVLDLILVSNHYGQT